MPEQELKFITSIASSYPLQRGSQIEIDQSTAIEEAVSDQIEAGICLVSDGNTREKILRLISSGINGIKLIEGKPVVVGEISSSKEPSLRTNYKLAESIASSKADVKGILIGPNTFAHCCNVEKGAPYKSSDDEELKYDLARAITYEAIALRKAGAEVIQIDELAISLSPDMKTARDVINSIAEQIEVPVLHVCGSLRGMLDEVLDIDVSVLDIECVRYKNLDLLERDMVEPYDIRIACGCVDTLNSEVESVEIIQNRILAAIERLGEENVWIKPDCCMRDLPRDAAFQKLKNMVEATRRVEKKLS